MARPGDVSYAFTDADVFGVDPEKEAVPSVFVSVLVEEGGGRAPDRLLEAWGDADRAASSMVVREIDEGAETAKSGARTVVSVLVGAIAVIAAIAAWAVARSKGRGMRD